MDKGDIIMKERLEYRAYTGSVEFSKEDRKFRGRVMGIQDDVLYEGQDKEELVMEFETAVDMYLLLCNDAGKDPDKVSKAN